MARAKAGVEKALRGSLPRGAFLIIAVSGGIDSVVLLHAAQRLSRTLQLRLAVAHFDHGLRAASKNDAQFVKQLTERLELSFHTARAPEKPKRENTESWARNLRYAFLKKLRVSLKADYILTAHHANDSAETLLMRLVSNKELGALAAVDPSRKVLRPLLSVPRSAIESYAREYSLSWVEDETNRDESFLRNRIRQSLIPVLEKKFDPRIIETLAERATAIEADQIFIQSTLLPKLKALAKLTFGSKEWLRLLTKQLTALPPEGQWYLIEYCFRESLHVYLGRSHAQRVVRFVLEGSPSIEIPDGTTLKRFAGGIRVVKPEPL